VTKSSSRLRRCEFTNHSCTHSEPPYERGKFPCEYVLCERDIVTTRARSIHMAQTHKKIDEYNSIGNDGSGNAQSTKAIHEFYYSHSPKSFGKQLALYGHLKAHRKKNNKWSYGEMCSSVEAISSHRVCLNSPEEGDLVPCQACHLWTDSQSSDRATQDCHGVEFGSQTQVARWPCAVSFANST